MLEKNYGDGLCFGSQLPDWPNPFRFLTKFMSCAPAAPLFEMRCHAGQNSGKRGIYTPCFGGGGALVLTLGEGSSVISSYSADTGSAVSRGDLGFSARGGGSVASVPSCAARPQEVLVLVSGKQSLFMVPTY